MTSVDVIFRHFFSADQGLSFAVIPSDHPVATKYAGCNYLLKTTLHVKDDCKQPMQVKTKTDRGATWTLYQDFIATDIVFVSFVTAACLAFYC